MTKALPLSLNGVGFDARESARDAARRQGKTIGEWLHGVIADNAADFDIAEPEGADRDRAEIIANKFRGMDRRSEDRSGEAMVAMSPRRAVRHSSDPRGSRRGKAGDGQISAPGQAPADVTGDTLPEAAIEAMEHRAERAEARTSEAISSFAKMLESSEDKRDRERQSIKDLAQKLSAIETTLMDRTRAGDDNPVKGSLARLEARLDAIGRRSVAEAAARHKALLSTDDAAITTAPNRSLEDKLNSILQAVTQRAPSASATPGETSALPSPAAIAEAPTVAPAEVRSAPKDAPQPPRRFEDAVAEIAKHQQRLETLPAIGDASPVRVAAQIAQTTQYLASTMARRPLPAMYETLQSDMAGLARVMEEVRQELHRGRDLPERHTADIEALRADIGALSRSVGDLAPRGSVAALEDAIKAVADRVDASRDSAIREEVLAPVEAMIADLRRAMSELDPRQGIGGLEVGLRALTDKIDHLEHGGIGAAALAGIQDKVDEVRGLVAATATRHTGLEGIEDRVAALIERIERQAPAASNVAALETMIRDLGARIEAARAPSADHHAIEALQAQVSLLASRFDQTVSGLPVLSTLERSMRDLFAHLEKTLAGVETSPARAPREVPRVTDADTSTGHAIDTPTALRDEADARASSTLNAAHETLETIVDRLPVVESDFNDTLAHPAPPPVETRPEEERAERGGDRHVGLQAVPDGAVLHRDPREASPDDVAIGGVDPAIDAAFYRKPLRRSGRSQPFSLRGKPTDLDEEAGRGDFIAAARRAVQSAQNDLSVLASKRPGLGADDAIRAGLLARSRDYVASHKKPALLGFAALLVIVGTMTIMQRIGHAPAAMIAGRGTEGKTAVATGAPSRVVKTATATAPIHPPVEDRAAHSDALSPNAMPKAPPPLADRIAGSDPIQTSSIPSLPAFAAQGAALPPTMRSALPSGLMATAERGDAAAEYELAARYGDGRGVARDLKAAAKWYGKAAAQGIVPAQYRLASLYEKGLGVAQDKDRAKALYRQAADAGNPRAMHNLAVMLADGDGKPDYDAAAIWFRKAAQYGIHDSQFNLAILLARGLGVSQSLVQSYQWFAIAAEENDPDAAKKRDEVGLKLSANDIGVAKALAAAFRPHVVNPSAMGVQAPADGWDGAAPASHLNSTKAKISSL